MPDRVVVLKNQDVTFLQPNPALTHVINEYGVFPKRDRLAIHFSDTLRLSAIKFLVAYIHQETADLISGKFPILYSAPDDSNIYDPSLVLNHFNDVEFRDGRLCVDYHLASKDDQFRALLHALRADSARLSYYIKPHSSS